MSETPSGPNKSLLEAASAGDLGGLRAALAEGAGNLGEALVHACAHGRTVAAAYLLDHGADIEARESGFLPSFAPPEAPGGDGAEAAEPAHARPFVGSDGAVSPLSAAAEGGYPETVAMLLDRGADIDARLAQMDPEEAQEALAPGESAPWSTALLDAAFAGKPETVRLLLERGASHRDQALSHAVSMESAEAIKALLEHGANPGARPHFRYGWGEEDVDSPETILGQSVEASGPEILRLLLDGGADLQECGGAALSRAVAEGKADALETLLERGALIEAEEVARIRRGPFLYLAGARKQDKILTLLRARGYEPGWRERLARAALPLTWVLVIALVAALTVVLSVAIVVFGLLMIPAKFIRALLRALCGGVWPALDAPLGRTAAQLTFFAFLIACALALLVAALVLFG